MTETTASLEVQISAFAADEVALWSEGLAAALETYWQSLFAGGLVVIILATAIAGALVPLRGSVSDPSTAVALLAAFAVGAASLAALFCVRPSYRRIRRHRSLEVAVVVVASALVSAVHPLRSQLWLPSCGLIGVLAMFVPLARASGYCAFVLATNLAAHVASGDLARVPPVAIVGLWVGFPFWMIIGHTAQSLASRVIDQYVAWTAPPRVAPLRVAATKVVPTEPRPDELALPGQPPPGTVTYGGVRLTPRQEQVVALMIAGRRNNEIAEVLGIKEDTVSKTIGKAIERIGADHKYELVWRVAARWWQRAEPPSNAADGSAVG